MPATPYRVLFVCMGNICRSPAGENTFAKLVRDAGREDSISWDSAGTFGYHAGKAPDRRMTETLEKRGIPVSGQAREFVVSDFDDFDLILTMDEENYANVLRLARSDQDRARVSRFTDFCTEHAETEVPDPYYGGGAGFELVAEMMLDGCAGILEKIQKER